MTKIFGLLFILILGGGHMSCSQTDTLPEKLIFDYNGVSLFKDGDYISLTVLAVSPNAQREVENLDLTPGNVFISRSDFEKIWEDMKSVKWSGYSEPNKKIIEKAPPDINSIARLHLVIDDKSIIDWSRESSVFRKKAAAPLEKIAVAINKITEQRLADPIIPDRYSLVLVRSDDKMSINIELTKEGDNIFLEDKESGDRNPNSLRKFTRFFGEIQRLKMMCREYGQMMPVGDDKSGLAHYRVLATVEGHTVADIERYGEIKDMELFDKLCEEIAGLPK